MSERILNIESPQSLTNGRFVDPIRVQVSVHPDFPSDVRLSVTRGTTPEESFTMEELRWLGAQLLEVRR